MYPTAFYYIKTFGCAMNTSDSERIASFLEKQGFVLADKTAAADLVVFNTCGVKQTAENRAYSMIHVLKKNYKEKKIVLTGCLANRKDVRQRLKNKVDLFTEIKDFPQNVSSMLYMLSCINSKILNTKYQIQDTCLNKKYINYLSIKPKHSNQFQALVPIMTGCNNFCSYCIVPYARGREVSRSKKDIVSEIEKLANKKYKEIVLLGQNVNSYCDKKNNFPKLLDFLAKKFPQIIFKFLTSHPKDFSQELMEVIAKNKNISREIHLPIQSGSNKILKAMNRPYTQKHYLDLIKKARKIILGASFTTDVIVGFPGETEKDFQESVKVFQKVKYNEAFVNKYSPRPGTAAYCLGDPIDQEEKKRREKFLRKMI
ncbi:MAG TPA: MiaB/RimO family radical SAM methylthiotransferase [Candidatus Moranbacteria bacterium]|nr:MiaB/RimO family radical SAM methylthiotransferase [Candidatus Moranbacteria bacterium]HSA08459.1 MiaB/RimO family radical SAM methylthiotransferase [Candidatus Moranbacteria bacterium]